MMDRNDHSQAGLIELGIATETTEGTVIGGFEIEGLRPIGISND